MTAILRASLQRRILALLCLVASLSLSPFFFLGAMTSSVVQFAHNLTGTARVKPVFTISIYEHALNAFSRKDLYTRVTFNVETIGILFLYQIKEDSKFFQMTEL